MVHLKLGIRGLLLVAAVIPSLAQAQVGRIDRIGGDRREQIEDRIEDRIDERIDRAQVIRLSQGLVTSAREATRLAQREVARYRPVEMRALQEMRSLVMEADDLLLIARNTRQGPATRLRAAHREVEIVLDRVMRLTIRANFSGRVDRQLSEVQSIVRRLAIEIQDIRRGHERPEGPPRRPGGRYP